jgi:hypothetical protein
LTIGKAALNDVCEECCQSKGQVSVYTCGVHRALPVRKSAATVTNSKIRIHAADIWQNPKAGTYSVKFGSSGAACNAPHDLCPEKHHKSFSPTLKQKFESLSYAYSTPADNIKPRPVRDAYVFREDQAHAEQANADKEVARVAHYVHSFKFHPPPKRQCTLDRWLLKPKCWLLV